MKLSLKASGWTQDKLDNYLKATVSPLRIACLTPSGYPAVVPLWFEWDGKHFWCVTHKNARLLKYLEKNPRIGFEIANNSPPYLGVRGQGEIQLLPRLGGAQLEVLLSRYLPGIENPFTDWLRGRREDEVALKIYPHKLSAWDYSKRMLQQAG